MLTEVGSLQALLLLWLSPLLLTTSMDMRRRDVPISQTDWRQLFQSNIEETLKSDGGSWSPADNNTVTNVTVQLGATAYLHCHVRTTGDHAVSGSEVTCKINQSSSSIYFQ
ncbi:hypothetical protein CBL_04058 [Carabus blaptoides fortunei]